MPAAQTVSACAPLLQAGTGFGSIGGLVSRWRSDVAEALSLVDRFPALIEHHVRMNSDGGRLLNCGQTFGEWAADLPRNPRKQGEGAAAACVVALQHRLAAHLLPAHHPMLCRPLLLRFAGIAIAAMYSAAPALERIRQEQEEALVAAYAAREAELAAAKTGLTGGD